MWVELVGRGVEVDAATRQRVERRLGFALGRFGGRVGRVAVQLAATAGPRGRAVRRCRVLADVPGCGYGPVVVEDADADLGALVDRAAERAGQAVGRRLDRGRLYGGAVPTAAAPRG